MAERIAVVGAGLSGVTAALELQAGGHEVTVFDKSRGFGGRLATRRASDATFDHGAPFANGTDPGFAAFMEKAGAVFVAPYGWVGQPGMSSIARRLAEPLDTKMSVEIASLEARERHLWLVSKDSSPFGPFDRVISAIPAPQARRFTRNLPEDDALASVNMAPIWTLLLGFATRFDRAGPDAPAPFAALYRDGDRPGRPVLPDRWIGHADEAWTQAHLEADKDEVRRMLSDAFFGDAPAPEAVYASVHRWRYGRVKTPAGRPFVPAMDGKLLLGGDWALGPDAGHAWESGQAMAAFVTG